MDRRGRFRGTGASGVAPSGGGAFAGLAETAATLADHNTYTVNSAGEDYRQGFARIDAANAFSDDETTTRATGNVAKMLDTFDASHECREVTCLYHDTNWWIERAIRSEDGRLDPAGVDTQDYFL